MNYLIQNYYKPFFSLNLTPRLKYYYITNNLFILFFFLKINYMYFFNKKNLFNINLINFFYKYFFSKQIFLIKKKFNNEITGFYENNLQKSLIF